MSVKMIGKRLETIRESLELNQTEFAELVEITSATYTAYKQSKANPSLEALIRLCTKTGCSANWLLLGRGPIWQDDNHQESQTIYQINEKVKETSRKLKEIEAIIDDFQS